MKTKVLVIGVVEKGDSVLLRKKPDGSLPYKETWYLFGGELTPDTTIEDAIVNQIKKQTGITVRLSKKLSWDTEVKHDLDGEEKMFIYLDTICDYVSGEERVLDQSIEKLEWIPKQKLADYDLVPPSKVLFKKLGYL